MAHRAGRDMGANVSCRPRSQSQGVGIQGAGKRGLQGGGSCWARRHVALLSGLIRATALKAAAC